MAKSGLQKLKAKKAAIEAKIKKLSAIEAVKKRKQDKQVKFLVGTFFIEEAVKNGTLEVLKDKVIQSLGREADKQAVIAFGVDLRSQDKTGDAQDNVVS